MPRSATPSSMRTTSACSACGRRTCSAARCASRAARPPTERGRRTSIAALRGESTRVRPRARCLHRASVTCNRISCRDIAPDGTHRGFYALTFDITPLKEAERALERLARVDTLTGLGNRRQFDERLDARSRARAAHGTPLVLMSLDLDRFKAINDTHGHPVGDAVLRAFANACRRACTTWTRSRAWAATSSWC